MINIRSMTDVDLNFVYETERQSYSHPWSLNIFSGCLTGSSDCWVAELKGEIIGHLVTSNVLDEGHILNLCIAPAIQGKGFSHYLISFALQDFRSKELKTVFLEVRESNVIARNLYTKYGFETIGLRKNYYPSVKGKENAIVMSREVEVDVTV